MNIAIGCDHRGIDFKKEVIKVITDSGHEYKDFGCFTTESVDYPDIAGEVAKAVASGNFDKGILICSTGIGMSIAANKVNGIRAALCHDVFSATRARQHNNANVLCLAAETEQPFPNIINAFLSTDFEGERHQRRIDKITSMES